MYETQSDRGSVSGGRTEAAAWRHPRRSDGGSCVAESPAAGRRLLRGGAPGVRTEAAALRCPRRVYGGIPGVLRWHPRLVASSVHCDDVPATTR
jgi:hypothetical protein